MWLTSKSFNISYPDLQFDPLVILVHSLHFEVDSHCADEGRSEGVIGVAEQEGRLAYAAVANDQQLKHVVKVLVPPLSLPFRILSGSHLQKHKRDAEKNLFKASP